MNIQWFPGHMTKSLRMMEENAKAVDAIGYVLDARAPLSCYNPQFQSIIGNKPCVFILNKCDLADVVKADTWCRYFKARGDAFVRVTATVSSEAGKLVSAFASATENLRAKYNAKGISRSVRFMIMGVPNCGKSTIINCLSGKRSTVTGDKPGVTRGKQWVRLQSGLELMDTPGTLWPKFDSDLVASRLYFIGSISDVAVDVREMALLLLDQLKEMYPQNLSDRYGGIDLTQPSSEIFVDIAKRRGLLIRGGEVDSERCARAILDDFRKGKLGKITFDLPPDIEA